MKSKNWLPGRKMQNNYSIKTIFFFLLLKNGYICGPISENSSVGRARPCQGRGREFESRFSLSLSKNLSTMRFFFHALVVELGDTQDLKSCGHCGRAGSIPARGTL